MKYEAPELTALMPAINAVQTVAKSQVALPHDKHIRLQRIECELCRLGVNNPLPECPCVGRSGSLVQSSL